MAKGKRSIWREIPELWVVLLPLVLAVTMGATTLALALQSPDPVLQKTEAGSGR
ncbi:MAG: hypothetical protein KDI56_03110 [Xanthomonadales bacterium]|nr:hypothetical protein [Xanthomonadales bacterium]MCB1629080.1 hypothetical protein [Xanthomonadales bacterium]MCB1635874.1 hypothetical protein [Xanthomonadales bacterium]